MQLFGRREKVRGLMMTSESKGAPADAAEVIAAWLSELDEGVTARTHSDDPCVRDLVARLFGGRGAKEADKPQGRHAELTVYRPQAEMATVYRGRVLSLWDGRVEFVGGVYPLYGEWPEAKLALSLPSDWCEIEWLNEKGERLGETRV